MAQALPYPNITPKKSVIDDLYRSGYEGLQVYLWARSVSEAKQRAVEHFKPKKRTAGLLWVRLANDPHIVTETMQ